MEQDHPIVKKFIQNSRKRCCEDYIYKISIGNKKMYYCEKHLVESFKKIENSENITQYLLFLVYLNEIVFQKDLKILIVYHTLLPYGKIPLEKRLPILTSVMREKYNEMYDFFSEEQKNNLRKVYECK